MKRRKALLLAAIACIGLLLLTTLISLLATVTNTVYVTSKSDWDGIRPTVTRIVVNVNSCNEQDFSILDLSRFRRLKHLTVNSNCFMYVSTVNITGLSRLETIIIGENSFTKERSGYDPNRRFSVRNCPSLTELRIDPYSFSDYSGCEIEDTPMLSSIKVGRMEEDAFNFCYASLELRSVTIHKEWRIDMPSLKSLMFGKQSFQYCSPVALESTLTCLNQWTRFTWVVHHSPGHRRLSIQIWWIDYSINAEYHTLTKLMK